jgi:hypothetical protein
VVNIVRQQMNTMAEQARQGPTNPGGNNTLASQRDTAAQLANQLASSASPQYANANATVAQGRAGVLSPLQSGPLGSMTTANSAAAGGDALLPRRAPEGQAASTVQAIRALNDVEPPTPYGPPQEGAPRGSTLAQDLVRARITNALERGTGRIQGGENPRGGANVANDLAGSPNAAQTLTAAVDTVAPQASANVADLVEALRASGNRAPPGSNTAADTAAMSDLNLGETPMEALRAGARPLGIPARLDNMLSRWQLDRNAAEIMRVMGLSPDEATAYFRTLGGAGWRHRGQGVSKLVAALMGQQGDAP